MRIQERSRRSQAIKAAHHCVMDDGAHNSKLSMLQGAARQIQDAENEEQVRGIRHLIAKQHPQDALWDHVPRELRGKNGFIDNRVQMAPVRLAMVLQGGCSTMLYDMRMSWLHRSCPHHDTGFLAVGIGKSVWLSACVP